MTCEQIVPVASKIQEQSGGKSLRFGKLKEKCSDLRYGLSETDIGRLTPNRGNYPPNVLKIRLLARIAGKLFFAGKTVVNKTGGG